MMMSLHEEERRANLVVLTQLADLIRLMRKGLLVPETVAIEFLGGTGIDGRDPLAVLDGVVSLATDGRLSKATLRDFLGPYLVLESRTPIGSFVGAARS